MSINNLQKSRNALEKENISQVSNKLESKNKGMNSETFNDKIL